jgi:hypothetical protein
MPDYVTILGCEAPAKVRPLLDQQGLTEGEDSHTERTLNEALESVMGDFPDARILVLYHSTADWALFGVLMACGGEIEEDVVAWSLEEDTWRKSKAKPAPEVRVPLTVEADTLLDVLVDASDERGVPRAKGRGLVLPPCLGEHPKARRALAQVAARLKPEQLQVQLEIDGHYYEVTLARDKGVTLAPLHAWLDDEDARRLARSVLGTPAPGGFEPCPDPKQPLQVPSKRDPKHPLTTGSLKLRLEAAIGATMVERTEGGFSRWMDAPDAFEKLEPALRAPENAGARFAPLRKKIYELLLRCEPTKALPVLLSGLESEEDEEVRGEIYVSLSKMDDEAAHRAMARGFKVEPPGVLQRLSQVLWRQKGAVEVLVREHLAAAWSNDRGFANRIVKLLKDEYVEVQPSWIPHAPEELRRALGPVLARE